MINFRQPSYLQTGNERQQAVFSMLRDFAVFEQLAPFNPVLAGTFPIGLDIEGSDLDILACFEDQAAFVAVLEHAFGHFPDFAWQLKTRQGLPSVVARCRMGVFQVEFFAQPIPVTQQYAYRHMVLEYKILQAHGAAFHTQILDLKRAGYKTEAAFALLLGLDLQDPYTSLLQLESHYQ